MTDTAADDLLALALDDWHVRIGRQFGPLTRSQRRILHLLAHTDGLKVGDVAEQLSLTTAGATRMIDKLETLGYAYRFRTPHEDQRRVYVAPTPDGLTALAEADRHFLAVVRASLTPLATEERQVLLALLQKIVGAASVEHPAITGAPPEAVTHG